MSSTNSYTIERNAQIIIALLKKKGIKKVVASPGTTNISVIGSMMNDAFFEIYSAPDERSAAYIACGMAVESGEPVVISCTGATASRNYLPALTEAYYRKIPVLALTSSLPIGRSGHLYPQFIDRTSQPKDCLKYSTQIFPIHSQEEEWNCVIKVNTALLELKRHGGGPVHINLMTEGEFADFSVKILPDVRSIERYFLWDNLPKLPTGNIAIFIGSHNRLSENLQMLIDEFCKKFNAIVFCDQTSSYKGKYRVLYSLVSVQSIENIVIDKLDLLIHIGEVSGDYYTQNRLRRAKSVWRVNEDGEIRDYFRHLQYVFEMPEELFFKKIIENNEQRNEQSQCSNLTKCKMFVEEVVGNIPELPFSNIWVSMQSARLLPENSVVHFGILNSLRSWNFFEISYDVESYCNVGGFGIDGCLSTLIGASFVNPNKLYFGFLGDLAFFYDMNSLGNRTVGKNLRIMLINNGKGTEFRNYSHPGSKFGERADDFIAAGGHYGNKSKELIKHYAEDLGFKYLSASTKEEFVNYQNEFFNKNIETSIIFEVFTDNEDESFALYSINHIKENVKNQFKAKIKDFVGSKTIDLVKKITCSK